MAESNWVGWSLGVCSEKMGFVAGFFRRKTSKFAGDLIGSVLAFLVRSFLRMDEKSSCSDVDFGDSFDSVKSADSEATEFFSGDSSEEEEEDSPKLVFKFQSYEEFCRIQGVNHETNFALPSFSKILEDVRDTISDVGSLKIETLDCGECSGDGVSSAKDFVEAHNPLETSRSRVPEDVALPKVEELGSGEDCDGEDADVSLKYEASESMVSEDELVNITVQDEVTSSDGFLTEGDFFPYLEECIDIESSLESLENDVDVLNELKSLLNSQPKDHTIENETEHFEGEYEDMMHELGAEDAEDVIGSGFLSEDDFGCSKEIPESEMSSNWEEEDEDLETLWEHQDILEQLSIEIKNVRATGLPTIDEHTEFSKFSENLKPWKIEEKFQPGDTFSLVHKFYRSYWEKMRKLDILSYQKMYAIGLLQSKDLLKPASGDKSTTPTLALFNSLWRNKNRKIEAAPTMKFIGELQNDLELVYVGQLCLSWDILHWQYEKALELWETDPHGLRRFNLVFTEFQQFQVLLQRFIEDEQFQGPRVRTYVNCRRGLHNLLIQVPVIREDKKGKRKGSPAVDENMSSDVLVEAMEESIRIFWKFLRADKLEPSGRKPAPCELQDPADSELLSDLTKTLQKKEKKLKDVLRTGNCILKKFKRREDDSSEQVLCFFSQVDLRLVARVLSMSRLSTEQLHWCTNKLSSINFVNGRIHVEPSFSLFPC